MPEEPRLERRVSIGVCVSARAIESTEGIRIMKNVLFAACAAMIAATGALGASAGQFNAPAGSRSDALIRVDDNRYYDDSYYYDSGYQDRGYYDSQRGWYDDRYSRHDMVSPRWIVRNLERSEYRYISRPMLSGRFYQVKAINPNGKKVKLYIDAYSGRIVKVKG
jgi:hypothetical protein